MSQKKPGPPPREVVCPDTGEAFLSISEALEWLWAEGHLEATHWTLRDAIDRGVEKHGRYWDWRFPLGYQRPENTCKGGSFGKVVVATATPAKL